MSGGKTVYCGYGRVISASGRDTASVCEAIGRYQTCLTATSDGVPVCRIDRSLPAWDSVPGLSFVEKMAVEALSAAQQESGLLLSDPGVQLILSTTKGDVSLLGEAPERVWLWDLGERLSARFGCARKIRIVSCACISGVSALILGKRLIERGDCEHAFVLGVDEASDFVVSGFKSFKSLSPTLCRPYDEKRDGLTLGEACGLLVLTSRKELSPCGIVLRGGAISNDANHISGPSRTGDGLYLAISEALRQAGMDAGEISFVNAHGTGTDYNDQMESKAFALAGLSGTPCNSLKPYLGHTLGASGIVETILDIEQLRRDCVFGVKGFEKPGTPCPLNVCAGHRHIPLHSCLKTASGFGGTNAAIVLAKSPGTACMEASGMEAPDTGLPAKPVEICLRSSLLWTAEDLKGLDFAAWIKEKYKQSGEAYLKFFKMDNPSKLAYAASCYLPGFIGREFSPERSALVLSTSAGSWDSDSKHWQIMEQHLPEGASPAVFVYTLANIPAAEVTIRYKMQGEVMVFVEKEEDGFSRAYAESLLREGLCGEVLYARCDCAGDYFRADFHWMTAREKLSPEAGAGSGSACRERPCGTGPRKEGAQAG